MTQEVQYFPIPTHCPVCSAELNIEGQFLYCRSRSCPIQLSGSVKVWIKRLGLLHWGDALVDSLTDPVRPDISSLADLYRLAPEDLAKHCSGLKVARKCWDTLHAAKSIKLELLLASLNIPNLALATATDIVQFGYNSIEKILSLTKDQLLEVPNIGEITAQQVFDGLKERRRAIIELSEVLDIRSSDAGPLSGHSFCITGATSNPRPMVQKMIMDAGGIVKTSVGAGLSYLVTNDTDLTTKKMQNAKKHGTKIISEEYLMGMIRGYVRLTEEDIKKMTTVVSWEND